MESQATGQPLEECLALLSKEFSLTIDAQTNADFMAAGYPGCGELFAQYLHLSLEQKFAQIDKTRLYQVFRDVYLYHIDTLWVRHLDEMEELRDKVGLM